MRTRNKPHTVESLLELTEPEGDCVVWVGTKRSNGYGVTVYKGKQTTTHRVMYLLTKGEIPEGCEVDHICNNRSCIKPEHLEVVTHAENMRRGAERRTACRAGHEWTPENTYVARVKCKQGGYREQRFCRKCRALNQRALRHQQ